MTSIDKLSGAILFEAPAASAAQQNNASIAIAIALSANIIVEFIAIHFHNSGVIIVLATLMRWGHTRNRGLYRALLEKPTRCILAEYPSARAPYHLLAKLLMVPEPGA